jgi:hypothetical protein
VRFDFLGAKPVRSAPDNHAYALTSVGIDHCCWCIAVLIRLADPQSGSTLIKSDRQNVSS